MCTVASLCTHTRTHTHPYTHTHTLITKMMWVAYGVFKGLGKDDLYCDLIVLKNVQHIRDVPLRTFPESLIDKGIFMLMMCFSTQWVVFWTR